MGVRERTSDMIFEPQPPTLDTYRPKFYPFPENPDIVEIGEIRGLVYVPPEEVDRQIKRFAQHLDLSKYDAILVNNHGGQFFKDKLQECLDFGDLPVFEIEVHRDEGGYGATTIVGVPEELRKKRLLIIEDVIDSGYTQKKILEDLHHAHLISLVRKEGVKGQVISENCFWVVELEADRWLFDGGMDGAKSEDGERARLWGGLAQLIQA